MSLQHTPGPWVLDTCWNGWRLLANGRDITEEPFDCEHADARLIAAAPDLLAALEKAAGKLIAFADAETDDQEMRIIDEIGRVIRAAIAKAT